MKPLITEPLVHFLLLGAAIFALYSLVYDDDAHKPERVMVSQTKVESMSEQYARIWRREPTAEELAGLISDYVREEVAVREAVALELDRNDSVIRRLLRQKMEFVAGDIIVPTELEEAELQAYLEAHPEKFRTQPRFTFSHVYFKPQRGAAALADDIEMLSQYLNNKDDQVDTSTMGDVTTLEHEFTALPVETMAQIFGDEFATTVAAVEVGRWSAPIASVYGTHLVYVSDVQPGLTPALEQIREAVKREAIHARRQQAIDHFYTKLLERYSVTIESPQTTVVSGQLAAANQ